MPGLDSNLLDMLRCPHCARKREPPATSGHLQVYQDAWLLASCGYKFPMRGGIPILKLEAGDRWRSVPVEELPVPCTEESP